jgi:peptide methionine sulfoxide reductase MsrB
MSKCICSIRPIRSQIADFKKSQDWTSFDEKIDEKAITEKK